MYSSEHLLSKTQYEHKNAQIISRSYITLIIIVYIHNLGQKRNPSWLKCFHRPLKGLICCLIYPVETATGADKQIKVSPANEHHNISHLAAEHDKLNKACG